MIQGLKKLKTKRFKDKRGVINEIFNNFPIKSVTHTTSEWHTLRGIHVQGWDKIIYVARGQVFATFYDDRKKSPTYRKAKQVYISAGKAYFVPKGVGNSYLVVDESVEYFYFNTKDYDASKTYGLSYKDFTWPVTHPIVSKKDRNNKRVTER